MECVKKRRNTKGTCYTCKSKRPGKAMKIWHETLPNSLYNTRNKPKDCILLKLRADHRWPSRKGRYLSKRNTGDAHYYLEFGDVSKGKVTIEEKKRDKIGVTTIRTHSCDFLHRWTISVSVHRRLQNHQRDAVNFITWPLWYCNSL